MANSEITFSPIGRQGMSVTLRTEHGWELTCRGELSDDDPQYEGSEKLLNNQVVAANLWAYACAEKERRLSRDSKLREELEQRAGKHADMATNVADLIDKIGPDTRSGWCSACFNKTTHQKVEARFAIPTYLCADCGAATLRCVLPRCDNMATRGFGSIRIPRYCAEHCHEIASFERGSVQIDDLTDYADLLRFEKKNLAKSAKIAGSILAAGGAMTGVGLAAAPLIGGFIGTTVGGYTGAAATSYGLAVLGGGSVAAGGLGVAGGTAVVAAVGTGLGGVIGSRLTSAYVSEDDSFSIEKLKDGAGVSVIVCSGFLTEGTIGWGDWERIVTERYPNSPVYRVHWGAEELKDLTDVINKNAVKAVITKGTGTTALRASKHAAKTAGPIGGVLIAADLAKNPWWVAQARANKTGAILADIVARVRLDEVVLIGHSLGARSMICAAEALGTKADAPKVRDVHLLGAAINADHNWGDLNAAVQQTVFNYHSRNDTVLKFVYAIVQGGSTAAGCSGASTRRKKIKNVNVTKQVPDHSAYCKSLSLK